MRFIQLFTILAAVLFSNARAGTIATFQTTVGTFEMEFFDEHKPITVTNFIKYVQTGRFENMFIQRWETNFVFQGGGFTLETRTNVTEFRRVETFGPIQNEYRSGMVYSNVFGTIAMARQAGGTNSATSQWFVNVNDNLFLDGVDGGFTVFGRVISGTNVLDLFRHPEGSSGIYRASVPTHLNSYGEVISGLNTVPVLATNATLADLVFVDLKLRRDMNLKIANDRLGRTISWNSISGATNIVEYSTNFTAWNTLTNLSGTGSAAAALDGSNDLKRYYRVRLAY